MEECKRIFELICFNTNTFKQLVGDYLAPCSISVLLGGLAISAAGYAVVGVFAYHRAQEYGSIISTMCILLILLETLWNGLMVSSEERLVIVMPCTLTVGLLVAIVCRSMHRQRVSCVATEVVV